MGEGEECILRSQIRDIVSDKKKQATAPVLIIFPRKDARL